MVRWFFLAALGVSLPCLAARPWSQEQPAPVYSSGSKLEARRARADFPPDADLGKGAWKRAEWAEFDRLMSGKESDPAAATRVASLWTDRYIYFAFSCRYDTLNVFAGEDPSKERWELWNRDVAEVFLNPQPERLLHYYEFEVAPTNQWIDLEITRGEKPNHDAGWNSGFEHAARIDAGKHVWTAEMRIPLAALGVGAAKAGTEWRANFFRAAGRGSDKERRFLAWSAIPEGATFHVPSRFGILRLVE
jgi:Carbohydrate family 9 binding domain-like